MAFFDRLAFTRAAFLNLIVRRLLDHAPFCVVHKGIPLWQALFATLHKRHNAVKWLSNPQVRTVELSGARTYNIDLCATYVDSCSKGRHT